MQDVLDFMKEQECVRRCICMDDECMCVCMKKVNFLIILSHPEACQMAIKFVLLLVEDRKRRDEFIQLVNESGCAFDEEITITVSLNATPKQIMYEVDQKREYINNLRRHIDQCRQSLQCSYELTDKARKELREEMQTVMSQAEENQNSAYAILFKFMACKVDPNVDEFVRLCQELLLFIQQ